MRTSISVTACVLGALLMAWPATAEKPLDRQEARRMLSAALRTAAGGDTASAIATLDSVLAADPTNPDAPYRLGILRLAVGDIDEAESVLAAGVASAPLSRRLKLLLALVRLESDPASSEQLVDEVLMLRRHDVDGLYLRGRLALARGDSARALAVWDDLLAWKTTGGGR